MSAPDLDWDDDKPAKKPAGRGAARERLGQAANEALTDDVLKGLLESALESAVGVKANCPECGAQHTVRFPDFKKIIDVVTTFLEQAEGRPELRQPENSVVIVERPAR